MILCRWDSSVIPQELCGQRVGDVGVRACRSIVKDEAGFAGGIICFSLPPSLQGVGRLCRLSQSEGTEFEYVGLFVQGMDVCKSFCFNPVSHS